MGDTQHKSRLTKAETDFLRQVPKSGWEAWQRSEAEIATAKRLFDAGLVGRFYESGPERPLSAIYVLTPAGRALLSSLSEGE